MYGFIDTTEHQPTDSLPAEAMSIDGTYIENVIDGYKTLNVSGREAYAQEATDVEIGIHHGSNLSYRKYPARDIVVTYQMLAEDPEDYRDKFNQLNALLNVKDARLVFADEDDKFFVGTPIEVGDVEPGRNCVVGEFTIRCYDPFKYSILEYSVQPTTDETGTYFAVNYDGTMPTPPVLEAHFPTGDDDDPSGVCGYVAYVNDRGSALQFGNPDESNEVQAKAEAAAAIGKYTQASALLISSKHKSTTNWSAQNGFIHNSNNNKNGTIKSAVPGTGPDEAVLSTVKALQADSYSSGKLWHGATAQRVLPADGGTYESVTGAKDWELESTVIFAAGRSTKYKQSGMLEVHVTDSSGNEIAGVQIYKYSSKNKGNMNCFIKNKAVKTWKDKDFSHFNKYFGNAYGHSLSEKPDVHDCTIKITKKGNKVTFHVGGLSFSCTDSTIGSTVAKKMNYYFAVYANDTPIYSNAVYNTKFSTLSKQMTTTSMSVADIAEILNHDCNTFNTNDILIADCADASIRLTNAVSDNASGESCDELGTLGNAWEDFVLQKGMNQIGIVWSSWANAPSFVLKYRKKYI